MFSLQYQVAVYPPEATGFSSNARGRLENTPVEICTVFADGPRPIAYSPPKYTDVMQVVEEESATRYHQMSIGEHSSHQGDEHAHLADIDTDFQRIFEVREHCLSGLLLESERKFKGRESLYR